ncbi:pentapeptide repeat-containing protein [Paenibacillus peoriae]|uniref:pentapeptide repeat-containing protein n=1 Tax=Paenibacillus peoriae TaxID=59893 RepID=UPI00026C568B|nr:pentapeptide repeat-containing protein [Paenibacillus peoriae]MEC0181027.1 pentapeptide repeat-containing protein [Paenibacillus peoriae]
MQQQSLQLWLKQEVASRREALIRQLGTVVRTRFQDDGFIEEWMKPFRSLCMKMQEMQSAGNKRPVAYIHVSWLRSWLRQGKMLCSLEAYDDTWYLDRSSCMEIFEVPWLSDHVTMYYQAIESSRKLVDKNIPHTESFRILMEDTAIAGQYVVHIVRAIASRMVACAEFQQVLRADDFRIRAGEYIDLSEDIWVELNESADATAVRQRLESKDGSLHRYQDWRGLHLGGGNYENSDLAYTHLAGSHLSHSCFRKSICVGVDFSNSQMQQVDLAQSVIYDANFSGCDLQGANFQEAAGGEPIILEDQVLGSFGVSFAGANLQDANLLFADLAHACFQNANMNGAKVIASQSASWSLSEEQKQQIMWMEEDEQGNFVQVRHLEYGRE